MPSLHRKYIENMVGMFGDSALHGVSSLQQAHQVQINTLKYRSLALQACLTASWRQDLLLSNDRIQR